MVQSAIKMNDTRYPPTTWRLLISPTTDGATNMAIDEAILYAMSDGVGQATLRFYQWSPPCLSLGYNQKSAEVDEDACRELGYTWVRRPTGGRAILHCDELTYSVIAPEGEARVAGGIIESYRRLSGGLLAGLRALGADVFQAQEEKVTNPQQGTACFDTPSNYEITVRGKKLIGSAQVRRRKVVLQHGSLPLFGDLDRIFACLRSEHAQSAGPDLSHLGQSTLSPNASSLQDYACTLEEALGRSVSFEEAAGAISQGFARELDLELLPGELSDHERELAEQLRQTRYANDAWNRRT